MRGSAEAVGVASAKINMVFMLPRQEAVSKHYFLLGDRDNGEAREIAVRSKKPW